MRVVIDAQPGGNNATLRRGSLTGSSVTSQWTYPTPDDGPKVLEITGLLEALNATGTLEEALAGLLAFPEPA